MDLSQGNDTALLQLVSRYTHILDYGVIDDMDHIWTEDCLFQVDVPPIRVEGRTALKQLLKKTKGGYPAVRHVVSNAFVDWSGTVPVVHSYLQVFDSDQFKVTMFARYRDRCVQTAQGWRIAERFCRNG